MIARPRRATRALALTIAAALACQAPDEGEGREPPPERAANDGASVDELDQVVEADGESEGEAADAPAAHPASDLPFTLLATMASAEPGRSSATLRDDRSGTIVNVRPGDPLGDDAEVEAIERGRLLVRRGEHLEVIEVPRAGVRIDDPLATWSEAPDADDPGTLAAGVQLGPGPRYAIKTPSHAWGERAVVVSIQRAATIYARKAGGGPKIHIGDLSKRGGGHFPPHLSHRSGRDVDVGYVLQGPEADDLRFRRAAKHNLDAARTWALLEAFIAAGHVRIIFVDYAIQRLLYDHAREAGVSEEALGALLQYPRGEHFPGGVIRHFRGHINHFHVRYGPALAGRAASED